MSARSQSPPWSPFQRFPSHRRLVVSFSYNQGSRGHNTARVASQKGDTPQDHWYGTRTFGTLIPFRDALYVAPLLRVFLASDLRLHPPRDRRLHRISAT